MRSLGRQGHKQAVGAQVSAGCRDLIARMLVPEPQHRATAAEVMRHPWFRFGWVEESSLNHPLGLMCAVEAAQHL
jgi:serine/threonine protein kinase